MTVQPESVLEGCPGHWEVHMHHPDIPVQASSWQPAFVSSPAAKLAELLHPASCGLNLAEPLCSPRPTNKVTDCSNMTLGYRSEMLLQAFQCPASFASLKPFVQHRLPSRSSCFVGLNFHRYNNSAGKKGPLLGSGFPGTPATR